MAKAYKVKGYELKTDWLNGSELLDLTDTIMCEVDENYEAWSIEQSLEDLTEIGYTIFTKPITECNKAINKRKLNIRF